MLDKEYFLTSGTKTELGPNIIKIANSIPDVSPNHNTRDVVKHIMYAYANNIPMIRGQEQPKILSLTGIEMAVVIAVLYL